VASDEAAPDENVALASTPASVLSTFSGSVSLAGALSGPNEVSNP